MVFTPINNSGAKIERPSRVIIFGRIFDSNRISSLASATKSDFDLVLDDRAQVMAHAMEKGVLRKFQSEITGPVSLHPMAFVLDQKVERNVTLAMRSRIFFSKNVVGPGVWSGVPAKLCDDTPVVPVHDQNGTLDDKV
jgi:hypothetical protein